VQDKGRAVKCSLAVASPALSCCGLALLQQRRWCAGCCLELLIPATRAPGLDSWRLSSTRSTRTLAAPGNE
jgi:hypothetical protein